MPTYVYECPECFNTFEEFHTVEERHNATCRCGARPAICIQPALIQCLNYYDKNLGAYVTGPQHKRDLLAARGVVEAGDIKYWDDVKPSETFEDRVKKVLSSEKNKEEFAEIWKQVEI